MNHKKYQIKNVKKMIKKVMGKFLNLRLNMFLVPQLLVKIKISPSSKL